jgi:hypothetical protein
VHERLPNIQWSAGFEQYNGESAAEYFERAAVPVDE